MGSIDYTEKKERTFTGMDREAGTMGNAGAVCGGGGPVNERDAERIWREVSLESKQEEPRLMKRLRENYGYVSGLCLLYGVIFAFCRYENPNGITEPVLMCAMIGISYLLLKRIGVEVKKKTAAYAVGMALLGISTAMTCSGFLVFFNMAGSLLLFLAGMMHQFYEDEKWSFPTFIKNITVVCFTALGHASRPFSHGYAYLAEAKGESAGSKRKTAAAVGIGILIAAGLLLVVFPTLLRSDMVFAGLFKDWFIEIKFGSAFVIGLMILAGFTASYALLSALCSRQFEDASHLGKQYNALVGITFTGILAGVYVLYAGVQIGYLFLKLGTLPEGVTYSAYAREGFFELLFVGIVNFILVLACVALFQENRLLRGILTVVCGCTFIMIASAVYRMALYVQTYHLTLLRILVLWFLTVLALIMGGVTVSIYRKAFPMFRYLAAVVGCGYILLSFAKPDRLIAEYNLRHWETVSVSDVQYILYGLSDDAVPVIAGMDLAELEGGVSGGDESGIAYRYEWTADIKQEMRNYFYEIADRYKGMSVREVNLAKLQARNAAIKWLEENE